MKKTCEKPVLATERFDAEDSITTSGLNAGTQIREPDPVSTESSAGMGLLFN